MARQFLMFAAVDISILINVRRFMAQDVITGQGT